MFNNMDLITKIINVLLTFVLVFFVNLKLIAILKYRDYIYENDKKQKNPLEGKKVIFIYDNNCEENSDGFRGYLKATDESDYKIGFYEKHIKRIIDTVLSFGGLLVLWPLFLMIAIAIKIEDPGPIFFT